MSNENKNLWIILIIAAFVVGLGGGFGIKALMGGSSSKGDSISLYPPTVAQARGQWLAKIDNYVITKEDFDLLMAQIPQEQLAAYGSPDDVKRYVFNQLIDQYVILIEAQRSGVLNDKKTRYMLSAALRQAIYQVYLEQQVKDPSIFAPSKLEEEQVYKQYGAMLRQQGKSATEIRDIIQQEVQKQKFQVWMKQFVTEARDKYKIEKNASVLDKAGLTEKPNSGYSFPGMMSNQ